jgi:3-methylcrotonyl-CoA carboxylase alpha subunit
MSERFKISGKRVELPEATAAGWKLSMRPGGWILAEGPDGERERLAVHEARGRMGVSLGGVLWQGEVAKDQRAGASGGGGSDADLIAQFPGKVRKVLVQEGAVVAEGDPLVLVEAMKMEFAIKAPFAGKVVRVLVKEAQQLSPGDRFVELAESGKK